MQETWVQTLGWKDLLEKGMATHSIFLPGKVMVEREIKTVNSRGHCMEVG